ncbi:IS3 family transposase [Streptomyces sp. NPDC005547]|uniref:IS3 family transposase n=1 Tax=Streptomyces sp. NPDC005547 TaxID=3154887 RepID=UPI00339F3C6E
MFGVEPVCRVLTSHRLRIATSAYCAAKNRTPSTRTVRGTELKAQISRVHTDNFSVYGVRRLWRLLHREGISVARCTVARLMRDLGLEGAWRGMKIRTTVRDDGRDRAADLLRRDFTVFRPNGRRVADFTYVATWSGIVHVAFVVDVFSRAIVDWSAAATSKRAKLVLDALDMALWCRDRAGTPTGPGLVHHWDAGSQCTSFAFTAHLMEAGSDASTGAVGDALDNAPDGVVVRVCSHLEAMSEQPVPTDHAGRQMARSTPTSPSPSPWTGLYAGLRSRFMRDSGAGLGASGGRGVHSLRIWRVARALDRTSSAVFFAVLESGRFTARVMRSWCEVVTMRTLLRRRGVPSLFSLYDSVRIAASRPCWLADSTVTMLFEPPVGGMAVSCSYFHRSAMPRGVSVTVSLRSTSKDMFFLGEL